MFKEKVMKIGKYTFDIIQRFGKPPNTNEFQQSELTFYFKFNLGKILKTGRKKMSLDIWKMAKQSELTYGKWPNNQNLHLMRREVAYFRLMFQT